MVARAIYSRRRKQAPRARRSDHTDEYFGETVADPYRWMEGTVRPPPIVHILDEVRPFWTRVDPRASTFFGVNGGTNMSVAID